MLSRYQVLVVILGVAIGTSLGCDGGPSTRPSIVAPATLSIASVTPSSAEVGSTVDLVVWGTGFERGATATMDGVTAATTFGSAVSLSVRVPLHAVGIVDLVVTNPGGQVTRLAAAFEYLPLIFPTVRLLSPDHGLLYGDITNISGSGFQIGANVTFDGVPAVTVATTSVNISAYPSRHPAGAVDVVVTNPNGRRVTVSSGYTYQDVLLSVSATQVAPGAPLTISWTAPSGRPPKETLELFSVNNLETPVWFAYANSEASGSRTLPAPAAPGQYQFAYVNLDDLLVVQSATVTVTAELPARPVFDALGPGIEGLLRERLLRR